MKNKNDKFKRTKLKFCDYKVIAYFFFHSIWLYLQFKHDKAQLEWMLMKLTASGRFERGGEND